MLVEKQNEEMVADLAPAPTAPPPPAPSTAPLQRPKIDRAALRAALCAVQADTSSSGGSSPVQYDSGGHDGLTDRSTDSTDGDQVLPDK